MTPGRPRAWVVVATLWLLVFSASSQIMIMAPILPLVGDELGIRESLLGTLVSVYSLMVGLFAVISGPFSDRVGRRRILLVGSALMAVGLAMHSFVQGYGTFLTVRILTGLAGGILSGSTVSYVGDYFPYHRRGWAIGWVMSGTAFGQIIGIPLGIVLAGSFGFRTPFQVFAVMVAATCLLVYLRVPQPSVQRSIHPVTFRRATADYVTMLRQPGIRAAAAAFFLMFLGVSLYVVYLPTWLEREIGISANQIAVLFLVGGIANVIVGPQAGRISDRIGRKGIILVSCIGLSIFMAGTTFFISGASTAYPWFFIVMGLVAMRIGPFSALLTALVPDERRGALLSLTVALGQVGFAVGATAAGFLYAGLGYRLTTILAGSSVLAMGLMVWYRVPEPAGGSGGGDAEEKGLATKSPKRETLWRAVDGPGGPTADSHPVSGPSD